MDLDERRQRVDDGMGSSWLSILLSGKFRWKETDIGRDENIFRLGTQVAQWENLSLIRFLIVFASFRFKVRVCWFFLAVSETKIMECNFASVRIRVSDLASLMNRSSNIKSVQASKELEFFTSLGPMSRFSGMVFPLGFFFAVIISINGDDRMEPLAVISFFGLWRVKTRVDFASQVLTFSKCAKEPKHH
ncbi:hypothetical protein V6N11_018263 [Hibiscus sabdariffa]|uniref:Transmembrane protein n=1 Tax=Hibiscus sabdariffa TaxID=183260 RepID=A0ABR2T6V8_9ROSI